MYCHGLLTAEKYSICYGCIKELARDERKFSKEFTTNNVISYGEIWQLF